MYHRTAVHLQMQALYFFVNMITYEMQSNGIIMY